jgi:hypothetical protein
MSNSADDLTISLGRVGLDDTVTEDNEPGAYPANSGHLGKLADPVWEKHTVLKAVSTAKPLKGQRGSRKNSNAAP